MRSDTIYKLILIVTLFFQSNVLLAQYQVMKVSGTYCTGEQATFVFTGSGCTLNWSVQGGTIESQSYPMVTVRWTGSTAQVYANYYCNGTSGSANTGWLSISNKLTPTISISADKNNVCIGTSIKFTATSSNGGSTPNYNWKVNGGLAPGATNSPTYTTSSLENGQVVTCTMVTSLLCYTASSVTSSGVTMNLTPKQVMTVAVQGPSSVCSGSTASFYALVGNGAGTLTYQWFKNGSTVGTNSQYFSTSAVVNGDNISCRVTSSDPCVQSPVTSANFTVTVTGIQTFSAGINPGEINICSGSNVTLTATSSHPASSYQWQMNGSNVSGQTSNTFTTSASTDTQLKSVRVIVTTSAGCVNQTTATGSAQDIPFTIKPLPNASITGPDTGCGSVALQASTGTGYSWAWKNSDGTTIGTSSGYTATASGSYYVITTLNGCSKTSSNKSVTINAIPANPTTPTATTNTCGNNTLTRATPPSGITWYWQGTNSTGTSTSNSAATYTASISGTNTYYLRARNNTSQCWSTGSAINSVTVNPIPTTPPAPTVTNESCGAKTLTRATPPSGVSYYWQGTTSNGTSTSSATVTYPTTGTPGTYTYYLRPRNTSTSCWGSQSSVSVTINPQPVVNAGSDLTYFSNDPTAALTGASPSGGTWSGAGVSGSNFSPSVAGVQVHTITYNYNPGNGCVGSDTRVITVVAFPTIVFSGSAYLARGESKQLDAGIGYDAYQWYKNNQVISGATGSTYNASVTGEYKVNATKNSKSKFSAPITLSEAIAQALDRNYIIAHSIQKDGITDPSQIKDMTVGQLAEQIQYFDGLGRPIQTVSTQGSPLGKDMVQPVAYDDFGRQAKQYLPYTDNSITGLYKTNAIDPHAYASSDQYQFYQPGGLITSDTRPYSETIFEPSPLNRPEKDFGPGSTWHTNDKHIRHQYLVNVHGTAAGQEKIIAWKINSSNMPVRPTVALAGYIVTPGGYYATGQLQIKSTRDEQGNEVREYTDKLGQVVLKKVQAVPTNTPISLSNRDHWAQTYYLYDDFGNLRFVLPPELSKAIHLNDTYNPSTTDLNNWAFQYKYDSRMRMIEKKVPGAGWVFLVYDKRDRLVMTQDGNQRVAPTKYWSFTKYDALNRPVMTGITSNTNSTQAAMQSAVDSYYSTMTSAKEWFEVYDGTTTIHGYTNKSYPQETNANNYLTVTYYDNYNFRSLFTGAYTYSTDGLSKIINFGASVTYTQPASANEQVKGQLTGTKVKVLDGGVVGSSTWLKTIVYYDKKYRTIQTISDNLKGGADRISNLFDFTGKILKTKTTHTENDVTWTSLVGSTVVGNKLIRTQTTNNWTGSGAISEQVLPAGQNGWVEVTVSETNTNRMIGLADTNPDLNFTSIDYAFYLNTTSLKIYENGTSKFTVAGALQPGEVLRIERTGTTITYKRNGATVYTSLVPSSTLLMVDASLNTYNANQLLTASLVGARTSFGSTSKVIERSMDYDHAGRLTHTWHKVDEGANILLAKNEYNELGQLIDKKLHSTVATASNNKQSIDYRYNIRGWLTKINESSITGIASGDVTRDYFGMQLAYNDDLNLGITAALQYNGNISAAKWSVSQGYGDVKQMGYHFEYDPLNRLKNATHRQYVSNWDAGQYDENNLTYDLNGNIKTLQRKGDAGVRIDNLTYNYGSGTTLSNKLLFVTDSEANATNKTKGFYDGNTSGNDYDYDLNGNMKFDKNKGITANITYNYMNLPELVTKGGNTIRYIYDATGSKLAQVVTMGTQPKRTDYIGEFVYEDNQLQFINTEEGRIVVSKETVVFVNSCDNTSGLATVGSVSMATQTINNEKYVKVTSTGTTSNSGITTMGATLQVVSGDKYKIRAKGYSITKPASLRIKVGATDVSWPGAALPIGANTESWTEQIITLTTSGDLTVGIAWQTPVNGDILYINEFEITRLATQDPEYQYHLKDHLGNTRVTFTTVDHSESATATMETNNESQEKAKFLNYESVKKINAQIFDHTNGTSPIDTYNSVRLTGGNTSEKYGLARSLAVMPGDVVSMEVYAKYLDPVTENWNTNTAFTNLIFAISGLSTGTFVEGQAGSGSVPFPAGTMPYGTQTGSEPKAYLNYLLFDDKDNLIDYDFKRVSEVACERGQSANAVEGITHQRLYFDNIAITQPGYMYIYLSNENSTPVEVFFDDFKVTHTKSPVIQAEDYYPFGLVATSYQRENSLEQNYLYNGKELQDELNIGWLDYGARMYMPEIGRWGVVDPLADHENLVGWSPYNYTYNNPIKYIDPDGKCPDCPDEVYLPLANHVYNAKKGDVTENGWEVVRVDEYSTGYKGALYKGTYDGKTEFIYANAGTEDLSNDGVEDIKQLVGSSSQYNGTAYTAERLVEEYSGVSFTGHSLGGGLASANALVTEGKAVTFNAAGLSKATKSNLNVEGNVADITAYIVEGEIVDKSQRLIGLSAEGNRVIYLPKSGKGRFHDHKMESVQSGFIKWQEFLKTNPIQIIIKNQ
jgi:RHS repeat-associated protein